MHFNAAWFRSLIHEKKDHNSTCQVKLVYSFPVWEPKHLMILLGHACQVILAVRHGVHSIQDCCSDVYSYAWDSRYLGSLVRVSDLPGLCRFRFASTDRLVMPPFKLSTIGSRTFNVAAAGECDNVTSPLLVFRKRLKTHLFGKPYPVIVL